MKAKLLMPYCAGAILLALNLSTICNAQPAPGTLSRITVMHVKPEMLYQWIDVQKESNVAFKKAGAKTRTVYQTYVFGNSYEYVTVMPFENYAAFDSPSLLATALSPTELARRSEGLRKCIDSSSSYANIRIPEISNLVDNDAPPPIIVVARYRVATGRMQDFINLSKSDILPVYKKANVRMTVARRGLGANSNDVTRVTYYSKFADIDGGSVLTKALGAAGAAKLQAKFAGIATLVEVVTRRRVDELSF